MSSLTWQPLWSTVGVKVTIQSKSLHSSITAATAAQNFLITDTAISIRAYLIATQKPYTETSVSRRFHKISDLKKKLLEEWLEKICDSHEQYL